MPLADYALTDVETLKRLAPSLASLSTETLQGLINIASAAVIRFTDRNLVKKRYTYLSSDGDYDPDRAILDGTGGEKLYLPEYPILSVDTVYMSGTAYTVNDISDPDEYDESDQVKIFRKKGYLFYPGGWDKGYKNIHLTYTAGFDHIYFQEDLDIIQGVVAQLAANLKKQMDREGNIKSEMIGRYSYTLGSTTAASSIPIDSLITGSLALILENYCRPANMPSPRDM